MNRENIRSDASPPAAERFTGGGEMGKLISSIDWSSTPLGPIGGWPESLRTTVNLALASNFPISIAWGPQRIQIYNDGYWPICGGKHPRSMGQDFKECWASAWPVVGEAFESASAGKTAFLENQRMFLDRNGYLEETFFTFSFSPIRDESGEVAGLFHPVTEMTAQTLAERRLGVLREVSDRSAEAGTLDEASETIVEALARHQLDVPFAAIYLLDGPTRARLSGIAHLDADWSLAPREVSLAAEVTETRPPGAAVRAAALSGTAVELDRLEEQLGPIASGPYPESPRQAMVLPVSVAGLPHPLAVLIAGVSPRRELDVAYRTFYLMLQEAVTNSLVNARSYEEEKKRAEALAELDLAKTKFFSNVSHEFRTPLTLMLGPLEDSLSDPALDPSVRERLDVAHRNALRLLKLVNSLLDFSRIEAGRVRACYQPTDLAAATADLASNFRSACERAGLELRVDCPPQPEPVFVDRDMWEKIVLNLLSNAFKFTLKGAIEVSLRSTDDAAVLRVRDTGTGIAEHELPRLFERFHRVEAAAGRTYEGTGIGLALVKELVRLHGGEIEVESELGIGSTVSLSIPLGAEHLPPDRVGGARAGGCTATGATPFVAEALRWLPGADSDDAGAGERGGTAESPVESPVESRRRILVADDNADMRDYVRRLLADSFDVEAVSDGVVALERIRSSPPDLVLTDVMMPRLDGVGLLRALRDDSRTAGIPIIMLSARAGEEARVEGMDSGADDYLVKPFSARELRARVETHLTLATVRRQGEARFRELADTAPAMLWITDTADRCAFLSRGWYEYTGQREAEGLGFGWSDAVHSDDRQRALQGFVSASARRAPFSIHFRVRRADGAYRWVMDAGRPRFADNGTWTGYIGSVVDVHEQKQTELALRSRGERLRLLWEAAGVILTASDPETMLRRLFSKVRDHVGIDTYLNFMLEEDGQTLRLASHAGISEDEARGIARIELGQSFCGTAAAERRPIVATHVQSSDDPRAGLAKAYGLRTCACYPLVAGDQLLGTLSFASRTRDELNGDEVEFLQTLSHYVTAAYQQMRLIERLRDTDKKKDEFLATLAHELRNPLAPIRTGLQVLGNASEDRELVNRSLSIMERQTAQLTRLIDDLMDVSRITRGNLQVRRSRIQLADVLQSALEASRPAIEEARHKLEVSLPGEQVWLDADPARLSQVFSNLLSNASKYTPEGGEIAITARIDGEEVSVCVADNGIGIPADMLDRVFDMFVQADRPADGYTGVGIGLTLVKTLVEMHGGTIAVRSPGRDQGSEFRVRLPRASGSVAAASDKATRAALDASKRRVLIVDDNRDAADLLGVVVRRLGNEVHTAHDGAEAVDAARAFLPEVVLMDIGMPRMDGFEAARRIRREARGRPITLVALTGWGQESDRQRTREAGFDYHLVKPADPSALAAILAEGPAAH